MSDWLVGAVYLLGALHAVPAWYFGKAAGIRLAREIVQQDWISNGVWAGPTTTNRPGEKSEDK